MEWVEWMEVSLTSSSNEAVPSEAANHFPHIHVNTYITVQCGYEYDVGTKSDASHAFLGE